MKQRPLNHCLAAAAAVSLTCATSVQAQDSNIQFRGFLTAGFTISDEEQTYLRSTDDDISFTEDSVFGLQVIAPISDKLTVQGQLLANGSNSEAENFDVKVDWAFASYEFSDNLTLRAGRIRLPALIVSEYKEAGYAYPWIRPPEEVYGVVPLNALDGIDALITIPTFANFDLTLQPYFGNFKEDVRPPGDMFRQELHDLLGANVGLSNDTISLKLHRVEFDFVLPEVGLEIPVEYSNIGVNVNHNNFVGYAEYYEVDVDPRFGVAASDGWYTTVGYRLGDFLPHITYGDSDSDPALGGIASETLTLGLRYELSDSSALKLEVSNVEPTSGFGGFAGPLISGTDANVLSAALDVIF